MDEIIRGDVNEEYAYSGYVQAGDFVFLTFCVGNVGQSVEAQVEGALDSMSERLSQVGLTLDSVVKGIICFIPPSSEFIQQFIRTGEII